MNNTCPICFYTALFDPPYDVNDYGSDEICPCCGFHFGYDDFPDKESQINRWRQNWIANGCRWFSNTRRPSAAWDPEIQLKGIVPQKNEHNFD